MRADITVSQMTTTLSRDRDRDMVSKAMRRRLRRHMGILERRVKQKDCLESCSAGNMAPARRRLRRMCSRIRSHMCSRMDMVGSLRMVLQQGIMGVDSRWAMEGQ